ncbi:50S ribosomal protein L23, chloroplastic-like isoform X1 [Amaranthus tricolor]|uniref:50S ribosomal protein L23, chloroplastic-like isoform X1 n=1 Tax=Amaranthus tricolor TaxID=29722 RepID=UPI00258E950C|nr:50S ribosomal protein L23, chloroplastic-like isoform X1 [Amaranthus tricolor]
MAIVPSNLHSLSSSFSFTNPSPNVSATSFTFQIPHKTILISRFFSKNSNIHATSATYAQNSFNFYDAVSPVKKPSFRRDLIVAQATEAVAPATEETAASKSKTLKKSKKEKYPRRILDVYQILQVPIITEAAIKNIADENSLLFTVDVRADKKMIREAVTNFFGVKVRKVNTLIRPDGTKKAYVMLNREFNASDLAKKIGIFPSSG